MPNSVWDELELVDFQRNEIDVVLKDWRSSLDRQFKTIRAAESNSNARRDAITDLRNLDKKFEAEVLDILLPHQRKVLREIHMRHMLRIHGLQTFVSTKSFKKIAGLSESDIRKTNLRMRSEKPTLVQEALKLKKKIVEKLLKPLNKSEKEALLKKWSYLVDDKNISLELLRVHLIVARESKNIPDDFSGNSVFVKAAMMPVFEMGTDGNFLPIIPETVCSEKDLPTLAVRSFVDFMKQDRYLNVLNIQDWQEERLNEMRSSLNAADQKRVARALDRTNSIVQHQTIEQQNKNAYDELRRVVNSQQWETFSGIVEKQIMQMQGPLIDLTQGELGKRLGISLKRAQLIEKKWIEALRELEVEVNRIEDLAITTFQESLPEKSQKAFKELIGSPLKKSPANIDVLLNSI